MPMVSSETIEIEGKNAPQRVRYRTEISIGFRAPIAKFLHRVCRVAMHIVIGPQGQASI
jgi:hypothetical protein